MNKVCCLIGCPDIPLRKELYALPSDYPIKQAWLAKIRDKIDHSCLETNGIDVFICHLHFKTQDFVFNLDDDVITTKQLAPNACPTVFPQNAEDWQTNLNSHLLLENAGGQSSFNQSSDDIAISQENGEPLGNIESLLSIMPETEAQIDTISPSIEIDNLSPNKKTVSMDFLSPKKRVTQTSSLSRLGTSPSLPSRLNYSCTNCDFKTTDVMLLKDHRTEKHTSEKKVERKINFVEPIRINSDRGKEILSSTGQAPSKEVKAIDQDEIEHFCSQCDFTTPSVRTLLEHQRTHDLAGSSTEELSDDENDEGGNEANTNYSELRVNEVESSNNLGDTKPIAGYVYRCPNCDFWAQSAINFHSHLVVSHNRPGSFKCSRCDFTSAKRRIVTKHIDQQRKENNNHDDAGWVMITNIGDFNYSQYLKPVKSFSTEKPNFSDANASITLHSQPSLSEGINLDAKQPQNETSEDTSESKKGYPLIHSAKYTSVQDGSLVEEKTSWRELLRLYRSSKKAISKLNDRMQSTQKKLQELLAAKEQNEADEKTLLDLIDTIKKRLEGLIKKKLETEYEFRKQECQLLNHQLTILKSSDAKEVESAQAAISASDKTRFELELKLKTIEQEIQEMQKQKLTSDGQLKEISESNAGIGQLMSMAQIEFNHDESKSRTLLEELAILDKRTRNAVSMERNRIKTSSIVERAKAARNYKRTVLMLQEKERKRLKRLNEILESGLKIAK